MTAQDEQPTLASLVELLAWTVVSPPALLHHLGPTDAPWRGEAAAAAASAASASAAAAVAAAAEAAEAEAAAVAGGDVGDGCGGSGDAKELLAEEVPHT